MEPTLSFWILSGIALVSYCLLRLIQKGIGNSRYFLEMIFGGVHFISIITSFIILGWKLGLVILFSIVVIAFPIEYAINRYYKKHFPEVHSFKK